MTFATQICFLFPSSSLQQILQKLFYVCFYSSPTADQRRDVCRAIITKYPHLVDAGGGHVSIKHCT